MAGVGDGARRMFLAYGFVRAQFGFADCEDGKPDITLGGVIASGFGITACVVHPKVATDAATAAPIEATAAPATDASISQQAATTTTTTDTVPAANVAPPVTQAESAYTFHGFTCEEITCAGHQRGYNWASEKGIDDPHSCYHGRLSNPNMQSFSEGCEAYVDESTGTARLDESDRYTDDGTDTGDGQ